MRVYLRDLATYSPYAVDWATLAEKLRGSTGLDADIQQLSDIGKRYQPQSLPRNERRRATDLVRLSFRVIETLMQGRGEDLAELAAVFASSGGDYDVVDRVLSALATDDEQISPTDFHNSVHNAAAGYWSIASGCHAPSTSLSAGDETFAVGLVEAAILCLSEQRSTLFVAYDIAPPGPLQSVRPIQAPFALAMLLAPSAASGDVASLDLQLAGGVALAPMNELDQHDADVLAKANPIVRAMPLLRAVAAKQSGGSLDGLDFQLAPV
jgi:hypothetical protein